MPGERTRYYATRPRRVPPEFCTDELLESCSPLAALLLYRLISQADDQGRLPGHAKYVKGVCFPMRRTGPPTSSTPIPMGFQPAIPRR